MRRHLLRVFSHSWALQIPESCFFDYIFVSFLHHAPGTVNFVFLRLTHWRWTVRWCSGDKPLFVKAVEQFPSAVTGFASSCGHLTVTVRRQYLGSGHFLDDLNDVSTDGYGVTQRVRYRLLRVHG